MCLEMKKFFCCIPLRVGLLIYAYIALVLWSFHLYYEVIFNWMHKFYEIHFDVHYIYPAMYLMASILQPLVDLLLVFSLHLSQVKCLKVFYWYNLVFHLPVFLVFFIGDIMKWVHKCIRFYNEENYRGYYKDATEALVVAVAGSVFVTGVSIYALLAVKSYWLKLERGTSKTVVHQNIKYVVPV